MSHATRSPLLVDLGAGAGGVTAALKGEFRSVVAVEGSHWLCSQARDRHGLPTVVGAANQTPLRDGCADIVTLLDVIEHLGSPQPTLLEARRLLRPNGHLVVTVPAHMWLWSEVDEFLGHHRRYNRLLLRSQLESAGFQVVELTHVFTWAVGPVWLQRRVARKRDAVLGHPSRAAGATAKVLTALERRLIARVALPLGTSILALGTPYEHPRELISGPIL